MVTSSGFGLRVIAVCAGFRVYHVYMKANAYSPWQIAIDAAPDTDRERLSYLIAFAVLAPSSHNTQPWNFRLSGNVVELHLAADRRLPVADPDDRQLYMSLGAALENMARAALSIGATAVITYKLEGALVATIGLKAGAKPTTDYRAAMVQRRSTRLPFGLEPIAPGMRNAVKGAQRGSTNITLIEGKENVETVARINADASERSLADPVFRVELVKWVRNNWTKQPDGMPGFVQNIPGPVSLLAPVIMPRVNLGPDQAKKDFALFAASPAVVVLDVEKDEARDWLDAGRTFEGICIEAAMQGYQTSALASAIEDKAGAQELSSKLHLKGRPVATLRLGKASKEARHTPRRSAAEVTTEPAA